MGAAAAVPERLVCHKPRRWRARQIVKNIPPSDMAQIRAKVAAMEVLQGLRKDWGCQRGWARDYLSSVRARRGRRDPESPPHPAAFPRPPHAAFPAGQREPRAGAALRPPRAGSAGQGALRLRPLLRTRPQGEGLGGTGTSPSVSPPPTPSTHLPAPQINRFNKSRDRAILITDQHLYKLEPRQQYRVMRALPLSTVSVPRTGWHQGARGHPGCPCPT